MNTYTICPSQTPKWTNSKPTSIKRPNTDAPCVELRNLNMGCPIWLCSGWIPGLLALIVYFNQMWVNKISQGDGVVYLIEGIRGENEYKFGTITIFKSREMRNKYWDEEGNETEAWTQGFEKYVTKGLEGSPMLVKSFSEIGTDYIVH